MCEGTELEDKPWVCLQWRNIPNGCGKWRYFDHHPNFEIFDPHSEVRFSVAVLEGKPVFENDIVYRKEDGYKFLVDGIFQNERGLIKLDFDNSSAIWKQNNFAKCFTWTPPAPKRTFKLNGVELPCPSNTKKFGFYCSGRFYGFDSIDESDMVSDALHRILTESRDKP